MGKVLFVTGIDTNIGKTYATGLLAKAIAAAGKTVITQKMIQTGCREVSEDSRHFLYGRRPDGPDLSVYLHVSLLTAYGSRPRWSHD